MIFCLGTAIFFGCQIAQVSTKQLLREGLTYPDALALLQQKNIDLVYIFADSPIFSASTVAGFSLSGYTLQLTGIRKTYAKQLSLQVLPSYTPVSKILPYQQATASKELTNLCQLCAPTSRFYFDPRLSRQKIVEMYAIWPQNALNLGKKIFVYQHEEQYLGMVCIALNENTNTYGSNELMSVSPKAQRQGIAQQLITYYEQWLLKQGITKVYTVTHQHNPATCALFEKNGYSLENKIWCYHAWRQQ
ncbi:MAG: GNAT family N-acetyltransferase [Sphingobacteriales bacterium]|nr:GNAT family N-acetyltransferase [Sphingobacteriales bacterium]